MRANPPRGGAPGRGNAKPPLLLDRAAPRGAGAGKARRRYRLSRRRVRATRAGRASFLSGHCESERRMGCVRASPEQGPGRLLPSDGVGAAAAARLPSSCDSRAAAAPLATPAARNAVAERSFDGNAGERPPRASARRPAPRRTRRRAAPRYPRTPSGDSRRAPPGGPAGAGRCRTRGHARQAAERPPAPCDRPVRALAPGSRLGASRGGRAVSARWAASPATAARGLGAVANMPSASDPSVSKPSLLGATAKSAWTTWPTSTAPLATAEPGRHRDARLRGCQRAAALRRLYFQALP